ncbi:MAG: signal peptide peptidase SppA [Euryarchaeota archaeon]|nr:signal peptide peptidase SppA [Euryarchaeota archaeon]
MSRNLAIAAGVLIVLVGISMLSAYIIARPADGIIAGDRVAVIKIHGVISMNAGEGVLAAEATTPEEFRSQLEQALHDSSVKAILVEINSPGGSVVASAEIAEAIKEARQKKPVVAWLGEIATSGGYYVASASSYIVADPGTITGSIGVISVFPEYSRLLEKLGINMTVIKAGEYKDFSTGYRPLTEEERRMVEEIIYDFYEQFIAEVASNRNLSKEHVRSIAEGRIYSAKRARELGLVDEVGTRQVAIRKAAELGGIEGEPKLVTYERKPLFMELFATGMERLGYGFAKALLESGARPGLR